VCACRVQLVQVLAMEPEEVPPLCPPSDRDRVGFVPRVQSMRMGFVTPRFTEHVHVPHAQNFESHGGSKLHQMQTARNSCHWLRTVVCLGSWANIFESTLKRVRKYSSFHRQPTELCTSTIYITSLYSNRCIWLVGTPKSCGSTLILSPV